MKLQTNIKPRKDGLVIARVGDQVLEFAKDSASGELVCEIESKSVIAHLLATGNFYPADEHDFSAADSLLDGSGASEDDDHGEGGDDAGGMEALPIEANTPPKEPKAKTATRQQKAKA